MIVMIKFSVCSTQPLRLSAQYQHAPFDATVADISTASARTSRLNHRDHQHSTNVHLSTQPLQASAQCQCPRTTSQCNHCGHQHSMRVQLSSQPLWPSAQDWCAPLSSNEPTHFVGCCMLDHLFKSCRHKLEQGRKCGVVWRGDVSCIPAKNTK